MNEANDEDEAEDGPAEGFPFERPEEPAADPPHTPQGDVDRPEQDDEAPREPRPASTPPARTTPTSSGAGATGDDPPGAPPTASSSWPAVCHLATLVTFLAYFSSASAPLMNLPGLLAALILWQALKESHPEAVYHAKEAFNFQVNVFAVQLLASLLSVSIVCCCLGLPILIAINLVNVGLTVYAAVEASNGKRFRYPYIWRPLDPEKLG